MSGLPLWGRWSTGETCISTFHYKSHDVFRARLTVEPGDRGKVTGPARHDPERKVEVTFDNGLCMDVFTHAIQTEAQYDAAARKRQEAVEDAERAALAREAEHEVSPRMSPRIRSDESQRWRENAQTIFAAGRPRLLTEAQFDAAARKMREAAEDAASAARAREAEQEARVARMLEAAENDAAGGGREAEPDGRRYSAIGSQSQELDGLLRSLDTFAQKMQEEIPPSPEARHESMQEEACLLDEEERNRLVTMVLPVVSQEAQIGLEVGQRVSIHGMVFRPWLNGKVGECTGYVAENQRWAVEFADGTSDAFKPGNLYSVSQHSA